VANTIALSTGEIDSLPIEQIRLLDRRRRKAQRVVAQRKRGSKHHAAAKRRVADTIATTARVRKHWNHITTTRLAKTFDVVCIEDLRIANMTASARGTIEKPGSKVRQKAGLNRSILEQAWFQFETFLRYKLEASRGSLIKIDPRNTSRKCPHCRSIDARNRESQASFRCVDCGHDAHADVNAACNIFLAGTRPSASTKTLRRQSRRAA
jgi:putative transposase